MNIDKLHINGDVSALHRRADACLASIASCAPVASFSYVTSHAFRCFPLLMFLILLPSLSYAAGSGTTALPILKTDVGARPLGMGGAFVALSDDIYGMRYNPAGIGQFYMPQASALYLSGIADSKLQYAGYGMPLPMQGVFGLGRPSFGFSVLFSQSGEMEYNRTNPDGSFLSSQNIMAGSDKIFTLAYGEKIAENYMQIDTYNLNLNHYAGLSLKSISSTLAESYSASAMAVDLGYMVTETRLGLSFGASLANIGGKMTYIEEGDPLPLILRAGAAYQHNTIMDQFIAISLEADRYIQESQTRLRLGFEYRLENIFTMRAGYQALQDTGGLTTGLGIHPGPLGFDFAFAFNDVLSNSIQLSMTYKFRPAELTSAVKGKKKNNLLDDKREKPVKPAAKPRSKPKKEGIPNWL